MKGGRLSVGFALYFLPQSGVIDPWFMLLCRDKILIHLRLFTNTTRDQQALCGGRRAPISRLIIIPISAATRQRHLHCMIRRALQCCTCIDKKRACIEYARVIFVFCAMVVAQNTTTTWGIVMLKHASRMFAISC